jgi:septum formation protein
LWRIPGIFALVKVVLASASPRRHELLKELVEAFEIVIPQVDELLYLRPSPAETVVETSRAKGDWVAERRPDALVIAADTIVVRDQDILGKPTGQAHARAMLRSLSGREHQVMTGVCLRWPGGAESFYDATSVRFRELTDEEIAAYVETGEPMDKAGSYAIQQGAAGFVEGYDGSLSNVIGLPLEELAIRLTRVSAR